MSDETPAPPVVDPVVAFTIESAADRGKAILKHQAHGDLTYPEPGDGGAWPVVCPKHGQVFPLP